MSISAEDKQQVIKEYSTKKGDTGSPEVQVAILTKESSILQNISKHTKRITTLEEVF